MHHHGWLLSVITTAAVVPLAGCSDHSTQSDLKNDVSRTTITTPSAQPAPPTPAPSPALFAGSADWTSPTGYRFTLQYSLDSLGPASRCLFRDLRPSSK